MSDDEETKAVKYQDWMNDSNEEESQSEENEDYQDLFERKEYEGKKGHLLLQLQKSYKGDDRFQLTKDFTVDKKMKKALPQSMLGAMSKRELDLLDDELNNKVGYDPMIKTICIVKAS